VLLDVVLDQIRDGIIAEILGNFVDWDWDLPDGPKLRARLGLSW